MLSISLRFLRCAVFLLLQLILLQPVLRCAANEPLSLRHFPASPPKVRCATFLLVFPSDTKVTKAFFEPWTTLHENVREIFSEVPHSLVATTIYLFSASFRSHSVNFAVCRRPSDASAAVVVDRVKSAADLVKGECGGLDGVALVSQTNPNQSTEDNFFREIAAAIESGNSPIAVRTIHLYSGNQDTSYADDSSGWHTCVDNSAQFCEVLRCVFCVR